MKKTYSTPLVRDSDVVRETLSRFPTTWAPLEFVRTTVAGGIGFGL